MFRLIYIYIYTYTHIFSKAHSERCFKNSIDTQRKTLLVKPLPEVFFFEYLYIHREYRINYSFNCDSSNVVYLLECTVCGVQYVGSTCTPFRLRFNNYKACSRKFNSGASVPQAEFFRHFTEEGHRGFLKDISVKIIDRLTGGNRMRESFWQYRLDCFAPKGLNTRQVDT